MEEMSCKSGGGKGADIPLRWWQGGKNGEVQLCPNTFVYGERLLSQTSMFDSKSLLSPAALSVLLGYYRTVLPSGHPIVRWCTIVSRYLGCVGRSTMHFPYTTRKRYIRKGISARY